MSRIGGLILACVLALGGGACHAQPQALPAPAARVRVDSGVLVGAVQDNARVFRNIPYAAPPVGPLRWKPPQPAPAWTGERSAIDRGPACPQPMRSDGAPNGGGANGATSEDCLQLNVFAPKAARKAPVMVWIHGGGHVTGTGWVYDGQSFARDGVIFVAINYRLGALGYFAHPALTHAAAPGEPLGNYGQMDQIAALKWVKRNIAAFGGDPDNVTVFGESAGAESTLALLATPAAHGLYQKAIVESGLGWFDPVTLADKERQSVRALEGAGVPPTATAADLRALPVETLLKLKMAPGPFVDGRLMTETATQAIADGRFDDVPLIIGSNSGEDSLMSAYPEAAEQIRAATAKFDPPTRAAYGGEGAAGDEALAHAFFTDRVMGAPARWVAAQTAGGKPSWLYYFSYVGSRFRPQVTRAGHAAEIQYMLEYWGRRTPMSQVSDEDRAVARLMHACWVSFARSSVPSCGDRTWPAYDPRADQLMEFSADSGVRTHFRKPELDAVQAMTLPALGVTQAKGAQ